MSYTRAYTSRYCSKISQHPRHTNHIHQDQSIVCILICISYIFSSTDPSTIQSNKYDIIRDQWMSIPYIHSRTHNNIYHVLHILSDMYHNILLNLQLSMTNSWKCISSRYLSRGLILACIIGILMCLPNCILGTCLGHNGSRAHCWLKQNRVFCSLCKNLHQWNYMMSKASRRLHMKCQLSKWEMHMIDIQQSLVHYKLDMYHYISHIRQRPSNILTHRYYRSHQDN